MSHCSDAKTQTISARKANWTTVTTHKDTP
jgi:hypothetical protein